MTINNQGADKAPTPKQLHLIRKINRIKNTNFQTDSSIKAYQFIHVNLDVIEKYNKNKRDYYIDDEYEHSTGYYYLNSEVY